MKTENMRPENIEDESPETDNALELILIALLVGLMGMAS